MAHAWDRDLHTGVAFMDDEHLALRGTLHTLRAALDAEQGNQLIQSLLDRFDADVRVHFADEEREMDAFRYPLASSHLAQHRRFLDQLAGLRDQCRGGEVELTVQLADFVETWFARHIKLADVPLAEWLVTGRPVDEPAVGAPRG